MPIYSISEPAPPRPRQVFVDRQRVDIAHATSIEIARGRMMNCMCPPPEVVGCQRENADDSSKPVIHQSVTKERPMTAVVLDHEQTDKKASCGNSKQKI